MAVWSLTSISNISKSNRIDSEFYRPEYQMAENDVLGISHVTLNSLGRFIPGPFGSAFHVKNYDVHSKFRYIRGQDVKPFILRNDDNVYMPESDYNRLIKYSLLPSDLLISVVGTLGNVAIVSDHNIPSVFSCKSTAFRTTSKYPLYLLAFLNSKHGNLCLQRRQRGAVQTGLNIEDLKSIPIPKLSNDQLENISKWIEKAVNSYYEAESLYSQAQQILESELGLNKLKFTKARSFQAYFSEIFMNNRADADYYQIPFKQLETRLLSLTTKPLYRIAEFSKGIEVGSKSYTSSGKLFIRVSNIKETDISINNSDKYISDLLFQSLQSFKPQVGELLLTKDGTPGICYAVDRDIQGIISGGIVKLNIIDKTIPSEYLALVINSKACRMQVERDCSGAVIIHWKPQNIRRLIIPTLPFETMEMLANLVKKSKENKLESKYLLEKAKQRVEELVKEAVKHESIS